MRWRGRRASVNIDDRRRAGGTRLRGGRSVGLGCGGLVVVAVLALVFGVDPLQLLEVLDTAQVSTAPSRGPEPFPDEAPGQGDELGRFASVVLADTEETWGRLFAAAGRRYSEPVLVLFTGSVQSRCGRGSSESGPFYCPADGRVYLDLGFFDQLERRFGAPGDFAQAYVIAHEVGHHVQNLLGVSDQVQRARGGMSREEGNQLSVRLELQADCYAGVWAHHAHRDRQLLEPGDVEEGLRAASAIGDDTLQRQSRGTVRPETWTHGSSQQRVSWLHQGLERGDVSQCDTFR